jgi:hypothetical protein
MDPSKPNIENECALYGALTAAELESAEAQVVVKEAELAVAEAKIRAYNGDANVNVRALEEKLRKVRLDAAVADARQDLLRTRCKVLQLRKAQMRQSSV